MKVFLDTAPILMLVEGPAPLRRAVKEQLRLWLDAEVPLGTSVLSLAELLEHPKRLGDITLQYRYRTLLGELLTFPFFTFDDQAAELAAELMARHDLRLVQAQQLAIAVMHEFDVFYSAESAPAGFDRLTFLPAPPTA